jgi:hypothetical protein
MATDRAHVAVQWGLLKPNITGKKQMNAKRKRDERHRRRWRAHGWTSPDSGEMADRIEKNNP